VHDGELRQVIVRGTGREKPTFLITNDITNDLETPVDLLVGTYARRWRVENGIAEAVKFFHLNALSSPILTKVHFDVVLTLMADTLYTMLARRLRGFEECNASKLYRHFVEGKGTVAVDNSHVVVTFSAPPTTRSFAACPGRNCRSRSQDRRMPSCRSASRNCRPQGGGEPALMWR
jgi:hypothetical protein